MSGWRTDIIIDPGTFGNSKACHILVDMMNNNVISIYEKHRVLSYITNAIHHFKSIAYIPHKGVRDRTAKLWLNQFIEKVNNLNYPVKFKTHLNNVLHYLSRKHLESESKLDNRKK